MEVPGSLRKFGMGVQDSLRNLELGGNARFSRKFNRGGCRELE